MSQRMLIRNVTLVAASRSYSFDLKPGINLIVGPVGTGKTSLLELIRYGLGGNALLSPVVKQVGRQLAMTVELAGQQVLLIRGITSERNRIAVHDPDGRPLSELTVGNPAERSSVSSFLMRTLGIPEVRVPTSRRNPQNKFTTVSFADVFSYMYLPQHEIDRSTVNHLDSIRDPKRRSTFEVLYGLIDAAVAEMQVELGELGVEIAEARSSAAVIESFLEALNLPGRQLLEEHAQSQLATIAARERELHVVRENMRDVSTSAAEARRAADLLADEAGQALVRRDRASDQLAELVRLRAQVVLDEQRTLRSMLAGSQLAAFEFRTCPRCLQPVAERDVPEGHCVLCTQPEPAVVAAVTLEDEVERLRGQLRETDAIIAESEAELTAAADASQRTQIRLADARARADAEAREAVAPFVDRVAVLSEELGTLRGRHEATQQALATHHQLAHRRARLDELRSRQARLTDDMAAAKTEREASRERIAELSEAFDEILREFQLPWYEASHIDSTTYLPMVGGKRLEELSSGGMKTLVNDAYFLAGLTYALRVPAETYLPPMMLIDTPRKNFGADEDDASAAVRIYNWIGRLRDSYGSSRFQLIIADNDIPAEARDFHAIRLSYARPLLDDLPHPGPELVSTLEPR